MEKSRSFYGNTPTGVGKTIPQWATMIDVKKHPHGRGEDADPARVYRRRQETPPRAWGRLRKAKLPAGISSKHPHGRGEDTNILCLKKFTQQYIG